MLTLDLIFLIDELGKQPCSHEVYNHENTGRQEVTLRAIVDANNGRFVSVRHQELVEELEQKDAPDGNQFSQVPVSLFTLNDGHQPRVTRE